MIADSVYIPGGRAERPITGPEPPNPHLEKGWIKMGYGLVGVLVVILLVVMIVYFVRRA
jgi:hypothetical protein